jgi:hypothetical protein
MSRIGMPSCTELPKATAIARVAGIAAATATVLRTWCQA